MNPVSCGLFSSRTGQFVFLQRAFEACAVRLSFGVLTGGIVSFLVVTERCLFLLGRSYACCAIRVVICARAVLYGDTRRALQSRCAGVTSLSRAKSAFKAPWGTGEHVFWAIACVRHGRERAHGLKCSQCFPRETSFSPVVAWNAREGIHPPPIHPHEPACEEEGAESWGAR